MKFLSIAVVTLLACCSVAVAEAQLSAANLTACGLTCLKESISQAGCSTTDTACHCNSDILPLLTTACLLANCTMHDSLVVSKVSASTCNLPHPDRSNVLVSVNATVVAITSVIIILRLFSKYSVSGKLEIEDWLITACLMLALPGAYFTFKFAENGFGKHVYDLNDGDATKVFKDFFIAENIYPWDLSLAKLSILAFYLRVFPYQCIRYASFTTITFIILSTTAISAVTINSCQPIPYFWNKDIQGKCLDLTAMAYAQAGLSILQDLIIICIPIPILKKQNLPLGKKIGVGFMFAMGSGGTIISMIRLRTLLLYGNSIDPTWDYVDIIMWTSLEQAIAMICACLPALRHLAIHAWPRCSASLQFSTRKNSAAPSSAPSSQGLRKLSDSGSCFPGFQGGIKVPEMAVYPRPSPKLEPNVHITEEEWTEVSICRTLSRV